MGCGSSRVVPHESPRSHLKSVSDTAIATSRGRLRLPKFSPIHKKLTEAGHTKGDTTDLEQTDLPVIGALADGTIRLVSVDWLLKRPHSWRAVRLQELEQLKGALLAPKDAAKAMGSSHRRVFVLSYGWLSKSSPDPFGVRLHAVRSALRQLRKAKLLPSGCGLFWDFLSIPQKPRTSAEDEVFKKGLAFMAALYASPLGACVLQMKAIPPRPEALVGSMRVCRLREGLASNHAAMTKAYKKYGEIERVEKVDEDEVVVHFRAAASRKQALIMDPKALGLGADSWACDEYNERVYSQRGWCVFEDAVSFEFLGRCTKAGNESMQLAMHQPNMPDKVYEISSLPLKTPGREVYKQQVHADVARRLDAATFIGKGDQQKVLDLYKTFQRDAAATAIRHRADLPGTPGKGAGPLPPIRGASNGRPGTPGAVSAEGSEDRMARILISEENILERRLAAKKKKEEEQARREGRGYAGGKFEITSSQSAGSPRAPSPTRPHTSSSSSRPGTPARNDQHAPSAGQLMRQGSRGLMRAGSGLAMALSAGGGSGRRKTDAGLQKARVK